MPQTNKKLTKKEDFFDAIKEEMSKLNFDNVRKISNEHNIAKNQILNIASKIYKDFFTKEEFKKAFAIATEYSLEEHNITSAAIKEFRKLIASNSIVEAIEWGKETKKIQEIEIRKIVIKEFEALLRNKKIKKAIEFIEKYDIPVESLSEQAIDYFNNAYKLKDYYTAALLGKKFGFSKKRTYTAAVKVICKLAASKDIEKIIYINRKFDIFSDPLFEVIDQTDATTLSKCFIKFVGDNLKGHKIDSVIYIFDNIKILNKKFKNETLFNMIESLYQKIGLYHNQLLKNDKRDKASKLKNHFELTGSEIPFDVKRNVITGAQNLHNSYLDNYDYENAKSIKNEYLLFSKNIIENSFDVALEASTNYLTKTFLRTEFDKSEKVIKDYDIPKKNVVETSKKIILNKLNAKGYKDAIEILKRFKINPLEPEFEINAPNFFNDMISAKNYKAAAEVGLHFEIDKKATFKASIIYWKEKISSGDFEEAFKIKKEHKLPGSSTRKKATEIYRSCLRKNDLQSCKSLRKHYSLDVGFLEIIIEVFKNMLKISKS